MPEKLIIDRPQKPDSSNSPPDPDRALQLHVEELYRDSRNDVYAYLITLGLPAAVAQDTAQEVFLRYYVMRQRGETVENPRAWIFRVAHNLGLQVRAKQTRLHPIDGLVGRQLTDDVADPERGAM